MAVTLLEIARIFATKAPGKIDADVLQLLWKVGPFLYKEDLRLLHQKNLKFSLSPCYSIVAIYGNDLLCSEYGLDNCFP